MGILGKFGSAVVNRRSNSRETQGNREGKIVLFNFTDHVRILFSSFFLPLGSGVLSPFRKGCGNSFPQSILDHSNALVRTEPPVKLTACRQNSHRTVKGTLSAPTGPPFASVLQPGTFRQVEMVNGPCYTDVSIQLHNYYIKPSRRSRNETCYTRKCSWYSFSSFHQHWQ